MTAGENARAKFSGNTCFYIFYTRHRQKIFLTRNIEAVLRDSETVHGRRNPSSPLRSASNSPVSPRPTGRASTRRKTQIDDTFNSLRPAIPLGGKDEPVLKVEAISLKRKRPSRPRPVSRGDARSNDPNRESPSNSDSKPNYVRCRCELTIYEQGSTTNTRRSKEIVEQNQLFRSNELCTITYESDDSAILEMDEPFFIKASKLFVLTNQGPVKSFTMAESYIAQFALQPVDARGQWPPFSPPKALRWEDPFGVQLVANIFSLPMNPPVSHHELVFKASPGSADGTRADLSLELELAWSDHKSHSISKVAEPFQISRTQRPPTPNSEEDRDILSESSTITCYFFPAPVDETNPQTYFGAPNGRGQHMFTVPGFTCPFCDGREFENCSFLHFHLITSHDLFHFNVKQRKPTNGLRNSNDVVQYENYVEVYVDLSREVVFSRASDHVPDHRTFRWIAPEKTFDLKRLLKGDWSWLNDKRGLKESAPVACRRDSGLGSGLLAFQRSRINLEDVRELPDRKKRKYPVPQARNGVKGLVFIRSKSKRFIHQGEELSESDDEVDEDWLEMKHEETIEDFEDVARNEQSFMKLWDQHLFKERPIGYSHIPQVLIRFARSYSSFLRSSNLLVEFWKHCLNLVQYGIIDSECLKVCMEIVKGGATQWSSAGSSKWGLGMVGPLALDESPSSSFQTPPLVATDQDGGVIDRVSPPIGKEKKLNSGICICGAPWERPNMVRCEGLKCAKRWFHRSCFQLDKRPDSWLCPKCAE